MSPVRIKTRIEKRFKANKHHHFHQVACSYQQQRQRESERERETDTYTYSNMYVCTNNAAYNMGYLEGGNADTREGKLEKSSALRGRGVLWGGNFVVSEGV